LYLIPIEYNSNVSSDTPITVTFGNEKLDTNTGSVNKTIEIPLFPSVENSSKYFKKLPLL
jgi:hypothetical protein